jgi:hypothetical protein
MDGDQRLRRALAAFGGDVWALLDAALAAAARDRPEELRARRDAVVERLYAAAACSHCDGRPPRAALEEEAAAVSPEADADRVGDEEESSGLESKILAIRDFLEDLEQVSEESPSYHTSQRTRMRSSFFFHTRTFLLFCHSRRTSWRACCRTWRTWLCDSQFLNHPRFLSIHQSINKGENGRKRSGKPSHHFCSYKFLFGQ